MMSVENSDVCIFMVDTTEGFQKQDLTIFYAIVKNAKGIIVLVNKWDLIEKDTYTMKTISDDIVYEFPALKFHPIIFISIKKCFLHCWKLYP